MNKLTRFKCHKEVSAMQIGKIDPVQYEESVADSNRKVRLTAADKDSPVKHIDVSLEWYRKHLPKMGGYYVLYDDEYASYSPKQAFEDGYERIPA